MSTRGEIAIRMEDGTYRGIGCQHDSYPSHLGEVLFENYNTEEKVNALIDRGEASSIDKTLDECCFYADNGEKLRIDAYPSREALVQECNNDIFMEFLYIWENDKWYIYAVDRNERFIKHSQPAEYGLIREALLEANL